MAGREARGRAARRRKRAGIVPLNSYSKTCGFPVCRASRQRKYDRAKWERLARLRIAEPKHGPGWHCSECGADEATAHRRRKRLRLRTLNPKWQKVCTPACGEARWIRHYAARHGGPPRGLRRGDRSPRGREPIRRPKPKGQTRRVR